MLTTCIRQLREWSCWVIITFDILDLWTVTSSRSFTTTLHLCRWCSSHRWVGMLLLQQRTLRAYTAFHPVISGSHHDCELDKNWRKYGYAWKDFINYFLEEDQGGDKKMSFNNNTSLTHKILFYKSRKLRKLLLIKQTEWLAIFFFAFCWYFAFSHHHDPRRITDYWI